MVTNLLEYLDRTAERLPEKLAFSNGEEGLTFDKVQKASFSIGTCLSKKGYQGQPVGVLMERTCYQPTAFLGIWRAGGFYVPLDKEMPSQRLLHILHTAELTCLIADRANEKLARELLPNGQVLVYEEIVTTPKGEVYPRGLDTDPAYIVFTSGSTGLPKGVCACHRSVIDYGEHLLPAVGIHENSVLGCQSPLYFDAFLKEFLSALMLGATVYLIPRELFVQPVKLVEYLNAHKINTLCWVASALSLVSSLNTFKAVRPEYLERICFGSEVFPIKQLKRWQVACPTARFFNLYGPTECTGMSCFYPLTGEEQEGIPIGKPFENTKIFLLDEENRESREGEICIGGTCVTLGYYNDPERTAAAFIQNPLQSAYPERIYRTGDLGRWDEKGNLMFLGRSDQQIKHMGHRIELGEIESAAAAAPGVNSCVCLYQQKRQRMVLIYAGTATEEAVKAALQAALPAYMQPRGLVHLDTLPTTPNGKLDRRRLKELYAKE